MSTTDGPDTAAPFLEPGEELQTSFPVENGRILVTQMRLYLALDGREGSLPNVRLERSRPQVYPAEEWVEVAPRMGACLKTGQDGREFLALVEPWRQQALQALEQRSKRSRAGVRARYDQLLQAAERHGEAGSARKRKDTLRSLYAAAPERSEAAARLGEIYLAEGNGRAAAVWLIRAGAFDERFDAALQRVSRPRLPSRELPPPEWWMDRHLMPLLERADGLSPQQREKILAGRERIRAFRAARGRAGLRAKLLFVLALAVWAALLLLQPWWTLGASVATALLVGFVSMRSARGKKRPKR